MREFSKICPQTGPASACPYEIGVIAGASSRENDQYRQDMDMAGGHSDYTHGTMEVEAQAGTFSGFMDGTKYGGALVALVVLMPTLVFAVNLHWFPSLIATTVFGFILGIGLKLKGAWYVGIVALAVLVAIFSAILSAVV